MAHAPSPDPRRGYRGRSLGLVLEQYRQEGGHHVDDVDGAVGIGYLDHHAPAEVAARASAGCSAATKVAAGEVRVDTQSSRVKRWYYRYVPKSYTGTKPMPVVLDLHGYVEGATIHKAMSALGPFGDTHGFVTITPQGSGATVFRWIPASIRRRQVHRQPARRGREDVVCRRAADLRHRVVERRVHDVVGRLQVLGSNRGRGTRRRHSRYRGLRVHPAGARDRVPRHRRSVRLL